jgi:hypothetical protein
MPIAPSRAKLRLKAMLLFVFVSSPPAQTDCEAVTASAIKANFILFILKTYKKFAAKLPELF